MTTPTGKLAWGQAGNYDASDDRAVITAVTAGRVGLVRPVTVAAGTGLQVIIRGGWVGVASCDDLTSAVVGSREDVIVQANPGPATGSREDVVWCSTNPDEGIWEARVITRAQSAGLTGIPLVFVTVPANANLAAQMDLRSVSAALERRLMAYGFKLEDRGDYQAGTWAAAVGRGVEGQPVLMEPGQWYRVRFDATCISAVLANNQLEGRIGVGFRAEGQGAVLSQLARAAVFRWAAFAIPNNESIDWVFRHQLTDAPVWRVFDGRVWTPGGNQWIRPGGYSELGATQTITVEDIGS